jgi:HAD superfamily phosphatase (TIGR01668 family)
MFKKILPRMHCASAYEIDFQSFYDMGYRAVLFDVDNTLVLHDAPATEQAAELFSRLRETGFKTCIVSNNSQERVEPFARHVQSPYEFLAAKPGPSGYENAMSRLGVSAEKTIMVGDQLFTDIRGANKLGIYSIFVKPMGADPIFGIKLRRIAEWFILLN